MKQGDILRRIAAADDPFTLRDLGFSEENNKSDYRGACRFVKHLVEIDVLVRTIREQISQRAPCVLYHKTERFPEYLKRSLEPASPKAKGDPKLPEAPAHTIGEVEMEKPTEERNPHEDNKASLVSSIFDFVLKTDQERKRLQEENEKLTQENERLRKEKGKMETDYLDLLTTCDREKEHVAGLMRQLNIMVGSRPDEGR